MKTIYTVRDNALLLSDSQGELSHYYIPERIRDRAPEDRPREKLLQFGPNALTVSELLAVVLGVGTIKEDVLSMSHRALREYGERSLAGQKDAKALHEDLDIPISKAAQIVACGELGRRFFQRNDRGITVIRTAQDVFDYVKDMRSLPREHLRGIYLNTHYQVIHDEVISIGTINANIIHPREVFKPAIEYAAAAIILVHNHPSGVTKPSEEDYETTRRVYKAGQLLGIDLLDHVIVTDERFESIPLD